MATKQLADKAKRLIDQRGGTDRLKQDADRLKRIANGPGSAKDKAKAAVDTLKDPGPGTPPPAAGDGPADPR